MGTSIHLFVEYDQDERSLPFSMAENIRSLSLAELHVPNNYALFDALAGGRSYSTGEVEKPPLFSPRGLPTSVSLEVYYRYYHLVEDPEYRDEKHDRIPSWVVPLSPVSPATAKEWVDKSWSTLAPIESNSHGRPRRQRVSGPDWHSVSWLLLGEIASSLRAHDINETSIPFEMIAYLSAMRSIEANLGSGRSRIVFWFDN